MKWVSVLDLKQLPDGTRQVVEVDGQSILVINYQGELYAISARCPHMGAPLKNGTLTEEHAIVCPWHRSAFDLRTGDVKEWSPWPPVMGRVLGTLRREHALRVFPVKVEDGRIWVEV